MTQSENHVGCDAELIEEFVAQADVSDSTKVAYRAQLAEFSAWLAHPKARRGSKSVALVDASRGDVTRFMAYLTAGERFAAGQHHRLVHVLSASSRKRFLASLKALYCYLLSVELVERDPTYGIKRPKVKIHPGLYLSAEELRRLLEAPGSARDRVQVYLLAFTGARTNEIRCLRWSDVNFTDHTLRVLGKGDKYRTIDLHPRLMPELRRWHIEQRVQAERCDAIRTAKANPATDFVLLTTRGLQLSRGTISKQLKRRASRAGLYALGHAHREYKSDVTPHVLRRTFATLLLNGGNALDAVADVLGHEYVDTTRKHYAFASDERRRATICSFEV